MEIVLVRHGETDWNRIGRWQGHADPPLNELGRRQAAELAEQLVGDSIAAVYSSDLRSASDAIRLSRRTFGIWANAMTATSLTTSPPRPVG